jgi:peptide/nickel transport system permease protein
VQLLRAVVGHAITAVALILSVVVLAFVLIHLAPGTPMDALADQYGGASPELLQTIKSRFGLDRPWIVQLGLYVWNVMHGDLGQSFQFSVPVGQLILDRLPATLLLLGTAISVFALLGVILGVYSATHMNSVADNALRIVVVLAYAVPVFWFAQLLVYAFAVRYPLFPVMGMRSIAFGPTSGLAVLTDTLWHLVLPAAALGVWHLAVTQRFTRSSMVQTLTQDFIRTAQAKGLSRRTILFRHALRNALLPVVTMTGLSFAALLAGAALTETVFGWPGVGRLMYEAVIGRDRPLILGLLIAGSAVTIVADAVADLVNGLLDPRLRISS